MMKAEYVVVAVQAHHLGPVYSFHRAGSLFPYELHNRHTKRMFPLMFIFSALSYTHTLVRSYTAQEHH